MPGKGIDTAPGLQKPFNEKSKAADNVAKNQVSANGNGAVPRKPFSDECV